MRVAINAAIIQKEKLLIVRKKETWILPGGKPEDDEKELEGLRIDLEEDPEYVEYLKEEIGVEGLDCLWGEIIKKDLKCLRREIGEELSGTKIKDIQFYNQFEGITPHKGDILRARVYFANIEGQLYSVREGDSISKAKWISDFSECRLSDINSRIVGSLQQDKYL